MRKLILILAIIAPTLLQAAYHTVETIEWPNAKYEFGDCITPVNPDWVWYGQVAKVIHLMYAKETKEFFYYLRLDRDGRFDGVVFKQAQLETQTAKLTRCPF